MQEEQLYEWWQYYARSGRTIRSGTHRLRIIDSGELNTARGPDFCAARFELDGIIFQGDVECHVRRDDWLNHRHHLDKSYRSVLLHVTADPENCKPVHNNWSEHQIPTIFLQSPGSIPGINENKVLARIKNLPDASFISELQDLALDRFDAKTKRFLSLLEHENENQVFYEYFLRALGYPCNSDAFQILAGKLPWNWLSEHTMEIIQNPLVLLALYAGQAGFLQQISPDGYSLRLIDLYKEWIPLLKGTMMQNSQWQFAAVRPRNHPHQRLAAWVGLIIASRFTLKERLWDIVINRNEPQRAMKDLYDFMTVRADAYWRNHYAFGKFLPAGSIRSLIGTARISEILINVILPFFAAKALLKESEGFRSYLSDLFLSIPFLQPYGRITKKEPLVSRALKLWQSQTVYQAFIQASGPIIDN